MALAGVLELEWDEANEPKALRIELLTEDGRPVNVPTPTGERPVVIEANVEVGRPAGTRRGSAFNIPLAINIGPLLRGLAYVMFPDAGAPSEEREKDVRYTLSEYLDDLAARMNAADSAEPAKYAVHVGRPPRSGRNEPPGGEAQHRPGVHAPGRTAQDAGRDGAALLALV